MMENLISGGLEFRKQLPQIPLLHRKNPEDFRDEWRGLTTWCCCHIQNHLHNTFEQVEEWEARWNLQKLLNLTSSYSSWDVLSPFFSHLKETTKGLVGLYDNPKISQDP